MRSQWDHRRVRAALEVYYECWAEYAAIAEFKIDCGRSDFVVVDANDRVIEIEIKTTVSDWRNDYLKPRWHTERPHLYAFYWAIPEDLEPVIPYWTAPPQAGLIVASTDGELDWIDVVREASPNAQALAAPHIRRAIGLTRLARYGA